MQTKLVAAASIAAGTKAMKLETNNLAQVQDFADAKYVHSTPYADDGSCYFDPYAHFGGYGHGGHGLGYNPYQCI